MVLFALIYLVIAVGGLSIVVFLCALPFLLRKPAPAPNPFGHRSPVSGLAGAIVRGFVRMFDFGGRATRMEFWSFAVFAAVVGGVLFTLSTGLFIAAVLKAESGTMLASGYASAVMGMFALSGVTAVLLLILTLASVSMAVRRLHDINRSGWWLLLLLVFGYFILLFWFLQVSRDHDPSEAF